MFNSESKEEMHSLNAPSATANTAQQFVLSPEFDPVFLPHVQPSASGSAAAAVDSVLKSPEKLTIKPPVPVSFQPCLLDFE
jgi:hypothetical protein